ncbi:MAG: hypothetical protein JW724_00970 [Candidatus Altiarchaeota archaeon]|nr:hypothetical protein [Candidatus Altiarchaeota archaeon]
MDPVNSADVTEKAHKTNIQRLVEEFGQENGERIQYLYRNTKLSDENNARVRDFVPIFVYRAVREAFMTQKKETKR